MRTRLTLATLVVALAVFAPALSAQETRQQAPDQKPPVQQEQALSPAAEAKTSAAAKSDVGAPGSIGTHSRLMPARRIVIDQETGQPRIPTTAERAQMGPLGRSSSSSQATVNIRTLTQTELSEGRGWRLDLEGRLIHALRATVGRDGSVSVSHGTLESDQETAASEDTGSEAEGEQP